MRRGELIANLFLFWGPALLGIFVGVFIGPAIKMPVGFSTTAIAVLLLGTISITIAKISAIRKGKLVSWGSKEMSKANRVFYRFGYALFGLGLVMIVALLMGLQFLSR